MLKRTLAELLCVIMMVVCMLSGCGGAESTLDYGDAESFEAALNAGENLEGKTVRFQALELHPNSDMGYNVWAGEHLNFVSTRNPNIKEGDLVDVKATEISSILGSWFIKYEKLENAKIGSQTIVTDQNASEDSTSGDQEQEDQDKTASTSAAIGAKEPLKEEKPTVNVEEELGKVEAVDGNLTVFNSHLGGKYISAYAAVKNNSSLNIKLTNAKIEYTDNDGKLLSVDDYPTCVPEAIKPGQTGYIYSYYHDLDGVDLSNGILFTPTADTMEAENFYEVEVSDVSFRPDTIMAMQVIGRGTNSDTKDHTMAKPCAIFFDDEDYVLGFCYGYEEFDVGKPTAFEISGDLMSYDFDPNKVSRAEVYIQGDEW